MKKGIKQMKDLINKIIYQIYVRNFTEEGTFDGVVSKLDYIKELGTDIIYLLPVNTIGKVGRKGDLGSALQNLFKSC